MATTMNIHGAKGKNASGAITAKRFVKLDTAAADGETVKQCDTLGERCYGVALFSVSTAEITRGKGCSVITEGRAVVKASAAIAVGDPVAVAADGRAKVAATGQAIVGICDEPASGAGKDCSVYLGLGGGVA